MRAGSARRSASLSISEASPIAWTYLATPSCPRWSGRTTSGRSRADRSAHNSQQPTMCLTFNETRAPVGLLRRGARALDRWLDFHRAGNGLRCPTSAPAASSTVVGRRGAGSCQRPHHSRGSGRERSSACRAHRCEGLPSEPALSAGGGALRRRRSLFLSVGATTPRNGRPYPPRPAQALGAMPIGRRGPLGLRVVVSRHVSRKRSHGRLEAAS